MQTQDVHRRPAVSESSGGALSKPQQVWCLNGATNLRQAEPHSQPLPSLNTMQTSAMTNSQLQSVPDTTGSTQCSSFICFLFPNTKLAAHGVNSFKEHLSINLACS